MQIRPSRGPAASPTAGIRLLSGVSDILLALRSNPSDHNCVDGPFHPALMAAHRPEGRFARRVACTQGL